MTRRKCKRMFVKLLNGFYWYFESTMICDKSKTNIKHSFIHLHTYTHVYNIMTTLMAVVNTVENHSFEWNLNAKLIVFALE